jgi:hypothetical protein
VRLSELADFLEAEDFRPDSYSLSGGVKSECYVLREDHGLWSVFYRECGQENDKRTFTNESLACTDLLSRLRADPSTKQN